MSSSSIPGLVIKGFNPPLRLADFKLLALDMDSTLINIECVDEIAAAAGRKAEVAAITEAAMRGEITDYKESLRQRVALLEGVPVSALHEVYDRRLQLNPGAETLVRAAQAAGLRTLLVSGGFTFFTDRIRDRLGLDFTRSNVLGVHDGLLTGKMVDQPWGDICDGEEKKKMLLATCAQLHLDPRQAIHRRRRQRPADDGIGRAVSGLPRQAQGARAGDGRDQRRWAGSSARGGDPVDAAASAARGFCCASLAW